VLLPAVAAAVAAAAAAVAAGVAAAAAAAAAVAAGVLAYVEALLLQQEVPGVASSVWTLQGLTRHGCNRC
jgi:hypothetical protein